MPAAGVAAAVKQKGETMKIKLKRIYAAAEAGDGRRVLVDRMWPRGVAKESARIDAWIKEIAPSGELRKWFGHDPDKWEEFKRRYFRELDGQSELIEDLRRQARRERVTLVYAAKDEQHNNAAALKEYLERGGKG